MKTPLLVALAVGSLIATNDGKDKAAKEATKLEGTWTITSVVRNHNPLPEDRFKDARIVFQGETFTHKQGEMILAKGVFRLDRGNKPGVIDLVVMGGEKNEETTLGIYELEGNVLRICGARPGQERSTTFEAEDRSANTLLTCKRAEP